VRSCRPMFFRSLKGRGERRRGFSCDSPSLYPVLQAIGTMILGIFPVSAFKHAIKNLGVRKHCSIMWMHRNVLGSYVPTTMSCRYSSKRIKFFSLFGSFSACFVSAIFSRTKVVSKGRVFFEFPDHKALKFTFEDPDLY
jgi:hypothetical protein